MRYHCSAGVWWRWTLTVGAGMSRWQQIHEHAKNNPRDVRLGDICKLAEAFGFTHRAGGKHPNVYKRKGFPAILNFQDDGNGKAKKYQVEQLLRAIEELGGTPPEEGG